MTNMANMYKAWPAARKEPVTVIVQGTEYPVPVAMRTSVTKQDLARTDIQIQADDAVWSVPVELLDAEIIPRSRIIDGDGVGWVVQSAVKAEFDSRWRCVCRRER